MTFNLHFTGQLFTAAGRHSECVDGTEGERLADVLEKLAADGRDVSFRPLVLTPDGRIQRTLLLIVGDELWIADRDTFIPEHGMDITLMPPMAGG